MGVLVAQVPQETGMGVKVTMGHRVLLSVEEALRRRVRNIVTTGPLMAPMMTMTTMEKTMTTVTPPNGTATTSPMRKRKMMMTTTMVLSVSFRAICSLCPNKFERLRLGNADAKCESFILKHLPDMGGWPNMKRYLYGKVYGITPNPDKAYSWLSRLVLSS